MKRLTLLFADLVLIAISTVVALLLRDNLEYSEAHVLALLPYLLVSLLCAALIFSMTGVSWSVWRFSSTQEFVKIVTSTALTVLATIGIMFSLNRLDGVARSLPVLQTMTIIFVLISIRVLARLRHSLRDRPVQLAANVAASEQLTILVFGTSKLAELCLRSVAEFPVDQITVAGLISARPEKVGRILFGHRVLGTLENIADVIGDLEVHGVHLDQIIVASPFRKLSADDQRRLAVLETASAIKIVYVDELMLGSSPSLPQRSANLGAASVKPDTLSFDLSQNQIHQLARRSFWAKKRLFDVLLAGTLAVVLMPVILIVAVVAAVDVGFPILFWQQRPGVGGRPFRLYKLRTMAGAHDARGVRIDDANRSSVLGRLLRRTRLDELPQIYNILDGDMSFVGPRPLLPSDQPVGLSVRTLVRPGLTGWAQVNGGRDIGPTDKVALDVWYIQNATLRLDAIIFARTAMMILFGERVNRRAIQRAWSDLFTAGVCKDWADSARQPSSSLVVSAGRHAA